MLACYVVCMCACVRVYIQYMEGALKVKDDICLTELDMEHQAGNVEMN